MGDGGIYLTQQGVPVPLVDHTGPLAFGVANNLLLATSVNDSGNVAFSTHVEAVSGVGICTIRLGEPYKKVIQKGDALFGSTVNKLFFESRGLNNSGDIAFRYKLNNLVEGVAIARNLWASIPGDIDGDGDVDASDLAALLDAWGTSDPSADVDGDGTVGPMDLALLLGNWGTETAAVRGTSQLGCSARRSTFSGAASAELSLLWVARRSVRRDELILENRMNLCTFLSAVAAPILSLATISPAVAVSTWDRSAEAISILTKPGDPAGLYRITGAFKVEANDVSLLSLDTKVTILKNGTAIASQVFDIQASAGVLGDCVACPSPNTCVCAEPNGPCSCSALWLTYSVPSATPLATGDVIKLQLANASGSVADANLANDSISRTFDGAISFWNRRLHSAELTPTPCPGSANLYDLSFVASVNFKGLTGAVPFDGKLTLFVDGVVAASVGFCSDNPWIAAPSAPCNFGSCGGDCGTGSCAGSNVLLTCQNIELYGGAIMACACASDPLSYLISGIALPGLAPGASVKLVFSGNLASGLPEIPLLNDDNTVAVAQVGPPQRCVADLNGDGEVNAADLAIVLGAWGTCPR